MAFCKTGEIQTKLADLGLHHLLKFQCITPPQPNSKDFRKHFAFRRAAEIQLRIPDHLQLANKRYFIHRFHWPVSLLNLHRKTTTMLNPILTKKIYDDQVDKYGILNQSLGSHRNNYGYLVRDVIEGVELSPMETLDLTFQVQAPVATKDDILFYTSRMSSARAKLSSARLTQEQKKESKESVPTNSLTQITDATAEIRINTSPTDVAASFSQDDLLQITTAKTTSDAISHSLLDSNSIVSNHPASGGVSQPTMNPTGSLRLRSLLPLRPPPTHRRP